MNTNAILLFLMLATPLVSPLGELPLNEDTSDDVIVNESPEMLTSSETTQVLDDGSDDVEEGPTPPSVVSAPLDPLPAMSVPLARPPGFRPPTSFKPKKVQEENGEDEEHHNENVDVGFVVRRGRAKVMGFSRRKTEESK